MDKTRKPPPPPPKRRVTILANASSPPPPPPPSSPSRLNENDVGVRTSLSRQGSHVTSESSVVTRRSSEYLSRSASSESAPIESEQARFENFEKPKLLQYFYVDDNESLSHRVTKIHEGLSNKGYNFADCCEEIKKNVIFQEISRHVSNRIRVEYTSEVSKKSKTLPLLENELREKYPTCGIHITGLINQIIHRNLENEQLATSWLQAWNILENLKSTYSEDTMESYFYHTQSIYDSVLCELSIEDDAKLSREVLDAYFNQASLGKSGKDFKDFIVNKKTFMDKVHEHVTDRMATEYAELFDNGESRVSIETKLREKYPSKFEGILVKARYRAHMIEHFTYEHELKFDINVETERSKICTEPSKCSHPYHHYWEGVFVCWDCRERLNDTPEKERKYAKILSIENEKMSGIKNDPIPEHFDEEERLSYIGELSANRGIKIGFFEALVAKYNLWDCNTHDLIRLIVKPMTEKSRCRFVELPEMRDHTGPAHTFCTYAQKGRLGDVVAAFRDGNSDPDRCIWFDAFCVRQWPSWSPDLDFKSTIAHCKSFLAVCSYQEEVEKLHPADLVQKDFELSFDAKCKICFLRVWCLVEAHQACLMPDMPYIMKCGHYYFKGGMTKFHIDIHMLHNLRELVDIENAEASVQSDKERILEDIRNDPKVTVETLNKRIEMVISAAEENFYDDHSVIASAACGDQRALEVVLMDPEAAIHAAFCGFKVLLEKLLQQTNCDLKLTDSSGRTALICAAMHGHSNCAKLILEKDKNCVRDMHDNETVLMKAVYHGHPECLDVLLQYVKVFDESIIHMTDPNHDNDTAIDLALHVHQDECVQILRNYGAEVSSHHSHLQSSMDHEYNDGENPGNSSCSAVRKSLGSTW